MTLQELAQLCITLNVYSPYTQKVRLDITRLFEQRSGVQRLDQIGTEALRRFKVETLRLAKPVTFNGYLRHLKALGNFATEEGLVEQNPFERLRPAPKTRTPYKVVKTKVLLEAIQYLDDHPKQFEPAWFWRVVIRMLHYTLIRRKQLVYIQLKDLNFARQELICRVEGSKTHREWSIPLHEQLMPDLQRLVAFSAQALGRPLRPDDHLFVIQRFNPRYAVNPNNPDQMQPEQVTGFFKRMSNKLEKRIGAHRLRHTGATTLCNPEEGTPDLFAVQEILGHTDLNTTRMYVQTQLHRLRTQVNCLPTIENGKGN